MGYVARSNAPLCQQKKVTCLLQCICTPRPTVFCSHFIPPYPLSLLVPSTPGHPSLLLAPLQHTGSSPRIPDCKPPSFALSHSAFIQQRQCLECPTSAGPFWWPSLLSSPQECSLATQKAPLYLGPPLSLTLIQTISWHRNKNRHSATT